MFPLKVFERWGAGKKNFFKKFSSPRNSFAIAPFLLSALSAAVHFTGDQCSSLSSSEKKFSIYPSRSAAMALPAAVNIFSGM